MEQERISKSLEGIERIYPTSYQTFEDKAQQALHVFETGAQQASRFATPEEILESSGEKCRDFDKVVNLLVRAEILPAWNSDSSTPYRVNTEEYSFEDLEKAYREVTGKEYEAPGTGKKLDPDELSEPVDDVLKAETEYESTD